MVIDSTEEQVRRELEIMLYEREQIINDMIETEEINDRIDPPYVNAGEVPQEVIDNYEVIETICLDSHELLIADIEIVELHHKLDLFNTTPSNKVQYTKFDIMDIVNYYKYDIEIKVLDFKISLCEVLSLDPGDYIYLKDVKVNEIASLKDNIE